MGKLINEVGNTYGRWIALTAAVLIRRKIADGRTGMCKRPTVVRAPAPTKRKRDTCLTSSQTQDGLPQIGRLS